MCRASAFPPTRKPRTCCLAPCCATPQRKSARAPLRHRAPRAAPCLPSRCSVKCSRSIPFPSAACWSRWALPQARLFRCANGANCSRPSTVRPSPRSTPSTRRPSASSRRRAARSSAPPLWAMTARPPGSPPSVTPATCRPPESPTRRTPFSPPSRALSPPSPSRAASRCRVMKVPSFWWPVC